MKTILLFIITILFLPFSLHGQNEIRESYSNTGGLRVSNISGYGVYYNRKITDDFRVQIMGLAFYYYGDIKNEIHKNFNYEAGLELQRDITKNQNFRLYILAGAYYYFDDDELVSEINSIQKVNKSFNIGVGIALEYYFKRFVFSVDLGYKYFEDKKVITENDNLPYPELFRVTKVGAGVGIGFMF